MALIRILKRLGWGIRVVAELIIGIPLILALLANAWFRKPRPISNFSYSHCHEVGHEFGGSYFDSQENADVRICLRCAHKELKFRSCQVP